MSIVRRGIAPRLEAEADRLIRESLRGVTKHSEKADILTPWKEQDRRNREVYVATGIPDASARRGLFHRAWNSGRPDLNSREGLLRSSRVSRSTFGAFVEEQGYPEGDD